MKYKRKSIDSEASFLSTFDRQVYQCVKSKSNDLMKSNTIKKSIAKTLGAVIEEIDEEGNVVEVSIEQKLVNATIKDAIDNPDTKKLKDLAMILGELKESGTSVNVNVTSPAEMFKGIGFEEEVIEAEYKDTNQSI